MFNLKKSPEQRSANLHVRQALSGQELQKISELIYQRAGIVVTPQKRNMVYNRLARRLLDLNMSCFSDYISLLEKHPTGEEWQRFINALTTNLTSFFREAHHFPILAGHARARQSGYNVWCTAASSGEEAYSIAMTLAETLGQNIAGPRVWATDINTEVLATAMNGVYRLADIENLSQRQKKNWFMRGKAPHQDRVKVKKQLRTTICFQQLNLLERRWDIPSPFDAIFCRNVMIYFDQKTQHQLLLRFARMLKPGGLLFVGHSENFSNLDIPFRLRGQSVYELKQVTS
ncbi:CheR family methyltransferase [[Erwinia] mediterraneensis]|uniref:CheR family methyltransferase n=1 Tax=[Erwinia] mediterraneensis TaxID=2161819 RepID=UPI00103072EE|nr:CheR family methyltransferase [[Erwinia] mediterraneensis]